MARGTLGHGASSVCFASDTHDRLLPLQHDRGGGGEGGGAWGWVDTKRERGGRKEGEEEEGRERGREEEEGRERRRETGKKGR